MKIRDIAGDVIGVICLVIICIGAMFLPLLF